MKTIEYTSYTYETKKVWLFIAINLVSMSLAFYLLSIDFFSSDYQFLAVIILGSIFSMLPLINYKAKWIFSERGIEEIITPRWKFLPFGANKIRFENWTEISSYSLPESPVTTLYQSPKNLIIETKNKSASIRIFKNSKLKDEEFKALIDYLDAISAHQSFNSSSEFLESKILRKSNFWARPVGRIITTLIVIFVLFLIYTDLFIEGPSSSNFQI
jgi:hypothetical protein